MSAVVLFVLFFVILLFGLPISVTMGISSILPWTKYIGIPQAALVWPFSTEA